MSNFGTVTLPLLQIQASSGGIQGAITLPLLQVSGDTGLTGAITLPLLEITGTVTSPNNQTYITLPLLSINGHANVGEVARGIITLPLLRILGQGYSQVLTNASIRLPVLSISGTALSGVIANGAITLPLLTISATELSPIHCVGSVILPLLQVNGYGRVTVVTLNRRAIVMNLFTHAVSHYENFNFNSLVLFNGVLLGANENGVYIIGGDNDLGQPIEGELDGGTIDLYAKGVMVPIEGWMAYRSVGGMSMKVRVDENTDPYIYPFIKEGNNHEGRAKIGKGIKGRFFTYGIKNEDGADFSIQSFRILGEAISRKTR